MIRTFQPVEGVQSAQGLDVSNFQGEFSWSAAKRHVPDLHFGLYRLTEGLPTRGNIYNTPDPDARWNHAQIRDQGISHRGAYHVLHPSLSGTAQAEYFVAEHERLGLVLTDILMLDHELTDGLPPAEVAVCAHEFMAALVALRPHNPRIVYTYINFASAGNCAGLSHYPLDLAYPSPSAPVPPPPWVKWAFWQWGLRNGIDADAFNGTAADLDAWVASFQPPPAGPPYRHLTRAGDTIGRLAASRNASVEHFLARCVTNYQPHDLAALTAAKLPAGVPFYTVNP